MKLGRLVFEDAGQHPGLLAAVTNEAIKRYDMQNVLVSEIDPKLADTAAFCEAYQVGMDISANCVVIEAKRADKTWYAACMILATNRADINGAVRRHLEARKISFAPMETAISLTKMEYGGITPIGLPEDWQLIIDESVASNVRVIIGSGIRGSKLLVEGNVFASLPNATVLNIKKL